MSVKSPRFLLQAASSISISVERLLVNAEVVRDLVRQGDLDLAFQLIAVREVFLERLLIDMYHGGEFAPVVVSTLSQWSPGEQAIQNLFAVPGHLFHQVGIRPVLYDNTQILHRVTKPAWNPAQCRFDKRLKFGSFHVIIAIILEAGSPALSPEVEPELVPALPGRRQMWELKKR